MHKLTRLSFKGFAYKRETYIPLQKDTDRHMYLFIHNYISFQFLLKRHVLLTLTAKKQQLVEVQSGN